MNLRFWKLSGAGNDFVTLVDGRGDSGLINPDNLRQLARTLCDRKFGVGGDGLLIIGKGETSDHDDKPVVRVDYLNSDGSRSFCGNGTRCALFLAYELAWVDRGEEAVLLTAAGELTGRMEPDGRFSVEMPEPSPVQILHIEVDGLGSDCCRVDTGVPYGVVAVEDIEALDMERLGPVLRHHAVLGDGGANAAFFEPAPGAVIDARFFERGVEAETLASGTGAIASAITAISLRGMEPPVSVRCPGGVLVVHCRKRSGEGDVGITDVRLEGDVTLCFTGEISVES